MDRDQLKKLLQKKADTLGAEALQEEGRLTGEQLEELKQLDTLLEIHEKLKPASPHKRWPVALMLGVCLAVVSLLLFVRLPKTEIQLDATLTDLHFILSEETRLGENIQLQSLGVTGRQSVTLPREDAQAVKNFKVSAADSASALSLSDLLLPAGTEVDVHSYTPKEAANTYRLGLTLPQNDTLTLNVPVKGRVNVILPGVRQAELEYAIPKQIEIHPEGSEIALDVTLGKGEGQSFALLSVHSLRFSRVDEYFENRAALPLRHVPTLLSGELYFIDLKGEKYTLREHEDFRMEESNGQIQSVRLSDNRIALRVQAFGRGISTGWGDKRTSLMPTLLSWFNAQYALFLLWGTALSLFALVNQVLRWWKRG